MKVIVKKDAIAVHSISHLEIINTRLLENTYTSAFMRTVDELTKKNILGMLSSATEIEKTNLFTGDEVILIQKGFMDEFDEDPIGIADFDYMYLIEKDGVHILAEARYFGDDTPPKPNPRKKPTFDGLINAMTNTN